MADPVYVFDLDETVLTINSFPRWVTFLATGRARSLSLPRRLMMAGATAAALAERKLFKAPHARFKGKLQGIWKWGAGQAGAEALDGFTQAMLAHRRDNLQDLVSQAANGRIDAILATAAVEEYAAPLAQRLGFAQWIATPAGAATGGENVGARKRETVLERMQMLGWQERPIYLLTDHRDDIPLVGVSERVAWFGSNEEMARIASDHPSRFLAARTAPASAIAGFFAAP